MKTLSLDQKLQTRLAALVAAKTFTTEPAVSAEQLRALGSRLKTLGMQVSFGTENGFPHLYASFLPLDQTRLWLAGHIDIVEAKQEQFTLKKVGDKLYGRGVFDMKYAIAIYEELLEELADSKPPVGMFITSDEEFSGLYGSGYLAKKLPLNGRTIILPDGGGPWQIERSAKGAIWAHIDTVGIAAHASRPHHGVNAIELALEAIHKVKRRLNAGSGETFSDTTVNIGRIFGGESINQVAPSAHFDLDIRFAPPTSLESVRGVLADVADELGVQITTSGESVAYQHDLKHPSMRLLHKVMADYLGKPIEYVDSYGSSDVQYFMQAGAQSLVFYPEGGGQHTDHEYITAQSLVDCYEILKRFIAEF